MLKHMRAIVTPQSIVGDCIDAVKATGLGRDKILANSLPVDHFTFVVHQDDYEEVSGGLSDTLTHCYVGDFLPAGNVTMGMQEGSDRIRAISWYYGNPLGGLAVVASPSIPLKPGGGYISAYTPSVEPTYRWLQAHDIHYEVIELNGKFVIWVPLETPYYGVGEGYYALAVVTESLVDTLLRMEVRAMRAQQRR